MQLSFLPVRMEARLTLARQGDALVINGETFDFSAVPEGASLPAEAVASDWIAGPVSRAAGVLQLVLLLPHGAKAPPETLFPVPVTVPTDGPVPLPPYAIEETDA